MSRSTGPRLRVIRSLGTPLPGLTRKSAEKRPHGPGQHGPTRRNKKASTYALRLREKQKLRFNYGLTERQLRRVVATAMRAKGNPMERIIEMLERRLDNVLFRVGFAATIPAGRQLATHGHVLVNGRRETIPSRLLSRGDVITVRDGSTHIVRAALDGGAGLTSPWIDVDRDALRATLTSYPDPSFLPFDVQPQLIIEHYSRVL